MRGDLHQSINHGIIQTLLTSYHLITKHASLNYEYTSQTSITTCSLDK
uniref:Uncharacterized protein n=1 Tax=Picea glauca TaxID=3330 RepID=A0A101M3F3_PICGL|nr:hypothetical protein ABT39_MTgene202 [Picea glauca]